ncbi:MAG: 23S rRNA (pseudouridine(1915)-N(3))-methyltransferase RlmH [Methylococcales bacterium]|nr:23S rRNA (pseudouridine(1915)-N(3))-methyltransferase RlmH [Methylococcales bacterium]
MQIHLISVGKKMPNWIEQGYQDYSKRLPKECCLHLKAISAGKRTQKSDTQKIIREEGAKMLAAIPARSHIVTLDVIGKPWTTKELSQQLNKWLESGQNVALLIGGPEGLSDAVKEKSQQSWSLSNLTFPHPLVRVLVAEQLYRAWSLLQNHPYHRE